MGELGPPSGFPQDAAENQQPSMLWTCTTCAREVNIFSRSDHLNSREHVKQLRRHRKQPIEPTIPEEFMWVCTVCDQKMHLFYWTKHISGKAHAKVLREKGLPKDYNVGEPTRNELETGCIDEPSLVMVTDSVIPASPTPPEPAKSVPPILPPPLSPSRKLPTHFAQHVKADEIAMSIQEPNFEDRTPPPAQLPESSVHSTTGTFYCSVCDQEISVWQQRNHQSSPWECSLCAITTHTDWMYKHISGSRHQKRSIEQRLQEQSPSHQEPPVVVEMVEKEVPAEWIHDTTATPAPINTKLSDMTAQIDHMTHTITPPRSPQALEKFYCDTCGQNKRITPKNLAIHRSPAWECTVCNKVMHIISKRSHTAGLKHARKLELRERVQAGECILVADYTGALDGRELVYCGVCDKEIKATEKAIGTHCSPAWECGICRKTVHLLRKEHHEATAMHHRALERGALTEEDTYPPAPIEADETTTLPYSNSSPGAAGMVATADTPRSTGSTFLDESYQRDSNDPKEDISVNQTPRSDCTTCGVMLNGRSRTVHSTGCNHTQQVRQQQMNSQAALTLKQSHSTPTAPIVPVHTEMFYCEPCERNFKVTKSNLGIHGTRMWDCTVCDVTMHLAWRKGHLLGKKHVSRAENERIAMSRREEGA